MCRVAAQSLKIFPLGRMMLFCFWFAAFSHRLNSWILGISLLVRSAIENRNYLGLNATEIILEKIETQEVIKY